jgi:hypothetical protein
MELLSSLPRGGPNMGFYDKREQHVRIERVQRLADLPAAQRPDVKVLRTDTRDWAELVESRRNRRDAWYVHRAGVIDLCNPVGAGADRGEDGEVGAPAAPRANEKAARRRLACQTREWPQAAFLSAFTAFSTSSTCPATLMPRHSATSTPCGSIRKVLRSMPLTFLPYMILFLTTPNMWQSFLFGVGDELEGQLEALLELSRATPCCRAKRQKRPRRP